MTKPLTPAENPISRKKVTSSTPPGPPSDKEAQKRAVVCLFTTLGFFLPGAFNLNYSAMFVMAILTFIVFTVFIFPTDENET
jgi:hypothetical protein